VDIAEVPDNPLFLAFFQLHRSISQVIEVNKTVVIAHGLTNPCGPRRVSAAFHCA
jgi:hypothetical protein